MTKLPLGPLVSPPVTEPDRFGPDRPSRSIPLSLSRARTLTLALATLWRLASPPQSPPCFGQLRPPLASPLVANASSRDAPPFYLRRFDACLLLLQISTPLHLGFKSHAVVPHRSAASDAMRPLPSTNWLPGDWLGAGGAVAPLVPPFPGLLMHVVVMGSSA
jgi:hypothetical protein